MPGPPSCATCGRATRWRSSTWAMSAMWPTTRPPGARSTPMQFFLDTGNLDEIRTGTSWGILDGVTTNPTLVSKEGMDHRALIREIAGMVAGPISVETTTDRAGEMVAQGRDYATWAPNVL